MHFKFSVHMNDKDYLDYNIFWTIRSPYGKKQMLTLRIAIAILFAAVSFVALSAQDFSAGAWIGVIPYGVSRVLFELLLNPFFIWILKRNIKALRKKGKMGSSSVSELEFYDDSFIETTPDNKSELKYTAVERVSVIADKVIYIHVNNVMSYIIPIACFTSQEQYRDFLSFVQTKCSCIDTY